MPLQLVRNGKDKHLEVIAHCIQEVMQASPTETYNLSQITCHVQSEHAATQGDIREAMWLLIDRGLLDLTPDRKLQLKVDMRTSEYA